MVKFREWKNDRIVYNVGDKVLLNIYVKVLKRVIFDNNKKTRKRKLSDYANDAIYVVCRVFKKNIVEISKIGGDKKIQKVNTNMLCKINPNFFSFLMNNCQLFYNAYTKQPNDNIKQSKIILETKNKFIF